MEHKKACGQHCLRIHNLGVTANGQTLLHDVNLHAHCGQLTVIIGRNGAGKSTLLKAILKEIPHTGDIIFREREDGEPHDMKIGYVPQTLNIDQNSPASVYDVFASFISHVPVFFRKSSSLRKKMVRQLELFDAGHLIDQPIGRLSGGELQRVLISMAVLPKPNLLILDEPVSGIDKNGMDLFYSILTDLKDSFDMSVLMVSHDFDFVKKYADRVILLDQTVICHGTPSHVFQSAEFQQRFGKWF